MRKLKISLFILLTVFFLFAQNLISSNNTPQFKIEFPPVILSDVPFELTVEAVNVDGSIDTTFADTVLLKGIISDGNYEPLAGHFENGTLTFEDVSISKAGTTTLTLNYHGQIFEENVRVIPGLLSLLPPLLAILLALTLREVLLALFCGVWLGATFLHGYNPIIGLMRALDTHLISSLSDGSHAAIIMFSLTLGGMVGVISRSGGTQGIVLKISRWANSPRGGQIASWLMGVLIFFDDYANTLIVGNTMRPLTDKLKISREKLSYIVDSTAAPVVSIAIISSWVGFQIGLIDQAFENLNISQDAYLTFIQSIPFASYSVLAIIFVFMIGITLRDFSTMFRAERRSFRTGKVLRDNARPIADDKTLDISADEGTPLRWYNAGIPILMVIVTTMVGLYFSGRVELGAAAENARLGVIIGAADSFDALMWASFIGAATAIILAVGQRILSLNTALDAWLNGVKAMIIAMIILVLAWAIGDVCGELKTADYVIALTKDILSPHFLPLLTFIVAAFIGFSTGTSWATMAILIPIVIPMSFKLTETAGIDPHVVNTIILGTIGAVLSGSVFGDHCSPISDTTIMSSMTSAADHIDHVRTQLPYAVTVATIAALVGYLPAGFGFPMGISILVGTALLITVLFTIGKRINARDETLERRSDKEK